ncbi:hypothetical protein DFH09DRAFT_1336594, partial [Mycena vulgaris]
TTTAKNDGVQTEGPLVLQLPAEDDTNGRGAESVVSLPERMTRGTWTTSTWMRRARLLRYMAARPGMHTDDSDEFEEEDADGERLSVAQGRPPSLTTINWGGRGGQMSKVEWCRIGAGMS